MDETNKTLDFFKILSKIDVSEKIEKKNGLSYLSWAWAWAELKKIYPKAVSKVYETESGCIYHTDGRTAWVKTSVTVDDVEHIEYLPIMDFRNKSIKLDQITSVDVNKAIQRSITKCISRFGLGLYIYAGEDLPEDDSPKNEFITKEQAKIIDVKSSNNKEIREGILKTFGSFDKIPADKFKAIMGKL